MAKKKRRNLLRRENAAGKETLIVCGIRIPYQTEWRNGKTLFVCGPLRIPYVLREIGGAHELTVFGLKLRLVGSNTKQRFDNYKFKDKMDEEKRKEVLANSCSEILGYYPNIEKPRSFNEKIMWLKFNYKDPLVTKCCDKFAVKDYIAEKVGKQYVVPTLGAWNAADEIDFDLLPDRFVLKVNWSSGYNIIVKDKSTLNREDVTMRIKRWMRPEQNSYYNKFNWGYKDMKPVVYAEEYIEQENGQLFDYKLHMSKGKLAFLLIATDRQENAPLTKTYFDADLNPLPFARGDAPMADVLPRMPRNLSKMKEIAEQLAEPFPFVRVDFYEPSDHEIYVGEMTFYSGGGAMPFYPTEWDYKLGELIDVP